MSEFAIEADHLTKQYGTFTAVDDVNLRVPAGGIFGLLGPNGAGKTTIIKLLTGLADLTAGNARVAGFDVRRSPMEVKARIGWVAAEVILDDDLSAWENLWLQAKLQRLTDWQERASELLRYFSLEDRRRDKVGTFSTGMRKKLEIALALLHGPRVIFMDEPTIGLDPTTRRMLWDLITGVNREYGITIFLTSHYLEEAEALCRRIAILDRGRIVAEGSPAELKSRIRSEYIELETSEEIEPSRFSALAGVQEVRRQGEGWLLKVERADEGLPRVMGAVTAGRIRRLHVEGPSLESVFLELTGRRLGPDSNEPHDYRKFYANIRRARG